MSEHTCYDERKSDDIQFSNNEASCEVRMDFRQAFQKIIQAGLISNLDTLDFSSSPDLANTITSLVAFYRKIKKEDGFDPEPVSIFLPMFSSGLPMEVLPDALIGREDDWDMTLLLITEALFKEAGKPVPDSISTALAEISQKLTDDVIRSIKTSFKKSAQLRAERGAKLVVDLPNINNREQTGMDQCV